MKLKKLTTALLTLGFSVSMVGGAFAETTPVQDPGTTTVVTAPAQDTTTTTTIPAPSTDTTTTPTPTTTQDPATTPVPVQDPVTTPAPVPVPAPTVVSTKAYPGTVKAVDVAGKKITVLSANKKATKEFTFDDKTTFIYKGKAVTLDKIGAGSRIVVNYQTLSDNTVKVVKVQIVQLLVKKAPAKPAKKVVKKTVKVTKVTKVSKAKK
jgi:hypothetical protein